MLATAVSIWHRKITKKGVVPEIKQCYVEKYPHMVSKIEPTCTVVETEMKAIMFTIPTSYIPGIQEARVTVSVLKLFTIQTH